MRVPSSVQEEAGRWFLQRILRRLLLRFGEAAFMGRMVEKADVYQAFSWWFQASKEDARLVMNFLERHCAGVRWSNRGLLFDKDLLKGSLPASAGGEPSRVVA